MNFEDDEEDDDGIAEVPPEPSRKRGRGQKGDEGGRRKRARAADDDAGEVRSEQSRKRGREDQGDENGDGGGACRKRARPEHEGGSDEGGSDEGRSDESDGDGYDDEALDAAASAEKDPASALALLLDKSKGRPLRPDEGWTYDSELPREIPADSHELAAKAVLSSVYWLDLTHLDYGKVKTPTAVKRVIMTWAKAQPWFKTLTVEPKAGLPTAAVRPYKLYAVSTAERALAVPRFFGMWCFGRPGVDARVDGEPMAPAARVLDATRPARPHQVDCIRNCLATIGVWGGALAEMSCGAGKSFCATAVATSLGVKTAIVVAQTVLGGQWRDALVGKPWTWSDDGTPVRESNPDRVLRARCAGCKKMMVTEEPAETCVCGAPLKEWAPTVEPVEGWVPGARVGWAQGHWAPDKRRSGKPLKRQSNTVPSDVLDKDFVIMTVGTIASLPLEIRKQFGLWVFDEAHGMGARTVSQLAAYCLGKMLFVTATPARRDGAERVLYMLGGPTAYVYKRLPAVTGATGTVRVVFVKGVAAPEVYSKSGDILVSAMCTALTTNPTRTDTIVDLVRRLSKTRKLIIVISTHVQHCAEIFERCKDLFRAHEAYHLMQGVSPSVLAAARGRLSRFLVATYALLSVGFDCPRADTMILAAPRSGVEQAVGRIERTHEGKLVPELYDVRDEGHMFQGMARKRTAFYKVRGFELICV